MQYNLHIHIGTSVILGWFSGTAPYTPAAPHCRTRVHQEKCHGMPVWFLHLCPWSESRKLPGYLPDNIHILGFLLACKAPYGPRWRFLPCRQTRNASCRLPHIRFGNLCALSACRSVVWGVFSADRCRSCPPPTVWSCLWNLYGDCSDSRS